MKNLSGYFVLQFAFSSFAVDFLHFVKTSPKEKKKKNLNIM